MFVHGQRCCVAESDAYHLNVAGVCSYLFAWFDIGCCRAVLRLCLIGQCYSLSY